MAFGWRCGARPELEIACSNDHSLPLCFSLHTACDFFTVSHSSPTPNHHHLCRAYPEQKSCPATSTAVLALRVLQAASCLLRPGGLQFQARHTGVCPTVDRPTKMRGFASAVNTLLAFIFVVLITPSTARPSVWDIHIDNGPAPPPDKGPPISRGALRDKSKLKFEIIGIVGAYIVWQIVTWLLLIFVGKRFRRRIQTSNRTLSMEIVRPAPLAAQSSMSLEPPLKSPGKMASLRSWATGKSSTKLHAHKPSNLSVTSTIDEKILAADRAKNMDDMTRLYAAVIQHDEEKAKGGGQFSPRSPNYPPQYSVPPTPRSIALPPTPRSPYYRAEVRGPVSPRSPGYPPEFQHLQQQQAPVDQPEEPPLSPRLIHPLAPTPMDDASTRVPSQTSQRKKVSPMSFGSADRKRPTNISIRGQPISQPLESAPLTQTSIITDEEYSPRVYNDPGPAPPTPGQKATLTPAAIRVEEVPNKRAPPAPLSLRSAAGTGTTSSASNSTNSLPFRQFYNAESMKSAPATKTTFVGVRDSIIGVHPKTGVPQTPYSPYMPYTPMTPVTPRTLVTKKEMKKNKKKEGLKVLSEDDLVPSDQELWSS
jgi:hypothetical protein